jgi:hypothetical protein
MKNLLVKGDRRGGGSFTRRFFGEGGGEVAQNGQKEA